MRSQINQNLKTLFKIEDTSGIELVTSLQRVARLTDILEAQPMEGTTCATDPDLSGPRWRIVLSLYIAEMMGKTGGMTPTGISMSHQVSKNTVSSLLRGLEDQGLIQRTLDPKDLRTFRIQLTPTGRELAIKAAPQRLNGMNQSVSGLSLEERVQLITLLDKLGHCLAIRLHDSEKEQDRNKAVEVFPSHSEKEIHPWSD